MKTTNDRILPPKCSKIGPYLKYDKKMVALENIPFGIEN